MENEKIIACSGQGIRELGTPFLANPSPLPAPILKIVCSIPLQPLRWLRFLIPAITAYLLNLTGMLLVIPIIINANQ